MTPRRVSCEGPVGMLRASEHVVAVIGDGALTGGMAWEGLNTIASHRHRPLVIVVNDNQYSYSPTVGALAEHLATLRATDGVVPRTLFADLGLAYVGPVGGHDLTAVETALREARSAGGPVVVHVIIEKGRGHPAALTDDERLHQVAKTPSSQSGRATRRSCDLGIR